MNPGRRFYRILIVSLLFCIFLNFVLYRHAPEILIYTLLSLSLIAYLAIRYDQYKANDTPEDYFLYTRRMPLKQFIPTYVTSNIGLFSSIAFSSILSFYYGLHGVVWPTLAWFVGMFWFSTKIGKLLPFFKNGNTLHEFLGRSYAGGNIALLNRFRVFTSVVTFLLYFASIGIEVKFSADVFFTSLSFFT